MNGEIVERLKYSFDGVDEELIKLMKEIADLKTQNQALMESNRTLKRFQEAYERQGSDSARIAQGWEEWATRQFTDENTAYILLDGEGVPQSWDEALTHLKAIREAFGDSVERIEANFIDTKREPQERRVEQLAKLTAFYRGKNAVG
ncbi:hypothetical protein NCHU2750_28410 [Neorhizobium sp. NCHU2750]|nr:hypothetical protein NCHU2750_28410 [Neorhizobium sp. NCHU2750]